MKKVRSTQEEINTYTSRTLVFFEENRLFCFLFVHTSEKESNSINEDREREKEKTNQVIELKNMPNRRRAMVNQEKNITSRKRDREREP